MKGAIFLNCDRERPIFGMIAHKGDELPTFHLYQLQLGENGKFILQFIRTINLNSGQDLNDLLNLVYSYFNND